MYSYLPKLMTDPYEELGVYYFHAVKLVLHFALYMKLCKMIQQNHNMLHQCFQQQPHILYSINEWLILIYN
jgi:hypothetical protein